MPLKSVEEIANMWRDRALTAEGRLEAVAAVIERHNELPYVGFLDALERAAGIERE